MRDGSIAGSATGSRSAGVAGPCRAAAIGVIAGASTPSTAATRPERPRNSISPSQASSVGASGSRTSSASSGSSSGTSRLSVTRSREMRICSAWPSSTSRRFGCLISPARASSVSRSPYSRMRLRRGLDADAGGAGHVVDRVAGERLHVDDPVGADAELLDHLVRPDRLVLQGVEHHDAGGDELHQVLVGADDGHPPAGRGGLGRVGRDDVVGLEAVLLDAGQVEGARRVADQPELRHEVVGRRRAVLPCSRGRARCGR